MNSTPTRFGAYGRPTIKAATRGSSSAAGESVGAFVARLEAKGVTFAIRNNRLWWLPAKTAASLLSAAERDYIAAHRNQIKELIASSDFAAADNPPTEAADITLAKNFHHFTGEDHASTETESAPALDPEIASVIFGNQPQEIERRLREATEIMLKQMRFGHPR